MNKEIVKYPTFSEIDFIKVYCALNFKNGFSPILKHHELEKQLYPFYYFPEFRELFQDIVPKVDYANPENSYLDLELAFKTAMIFGLLSPIYESGEMKSIIQCNEEMANEILAHTTDEIVNSMTNLFSEMHKTDGPKLVRQNL